MPAALPPKESGQEDGNIAKRFPTISKFEWVAAAKSPDGLINADYATGSVLLALRTEGWAFKREHKATNKTARQTWEEKLDYLRRQEAILSNPAQKFELGKQIEEVEQKIRGYNDGD